VRTEGVWNVSAKAIAECLRLKRQNSQESDFGFGIFLTAQPVRLSDSTYNFGDAQELFGAPTDFSGVGLIFSQNSVRLFKKGGEANRATAFAISQGCKAYMDKYDTLQFRISAIQDTLSVFVKDAEGRPEHLCAGIKVDPLILRAFYLTVSASDLNSHCAFRFDRLQLSAAKIHNQVVSGDSKKPGDDSLVFHATKPSTSHFSTVLRRHKENAKVMAEQLLVFADHDQKQVIQELSESISATENVLEAAVGVVENEAKQLETLNQLLSKERTKLRKDGDQLIDELLRWFNQIEDIFGKVDKRTVEIEKSLDSLKVNQKFVDLIRQIQKVQGGLDNSLSRLQLIKNDHNFPQFHTRHLQDAKSKVESIMTQLPNAFSDAGLAKVKLWLSLVAGVIVGAAVLVLIVIWCRMRTVVRSKRHF
jgi:hypothetical protein